MFKLSKESKLTFICLLIVPLIWIVLNHFGLLDFLEYKSVDLRFKARGTFRIGKNRLPMIGLRLKGTRRFQGFPR